MNFKFIFKIKYEFKKIEDLIQILSYIEKLFF